MATDGREASTTEPTSPTPAPSAFSAVSLPVVLAREYYARCREGFPGLAAVVSRGPLVDVLPGLSDVDLRLLCDGVAPDGWWALDRVVLAVHRDLATRSPGGQSLLQHPPGACVLLSELADPLLLHPEARLWDWCDGTEAAAATLAVVASGWGPRDEAFHLRRYLGSCDDWAPDPSVSGEPQGCRCQGALVHYFLPALESALSLEAGKAQPGRLVALTTFREREPDHPLLRQVYDVIAGQEHSTPGACADLAAGCRVFLAGLAPRLAVAIGARKGPVSAMAALRERLEQQSDDPLMTLYDAVRFSRVRRAHYRFFLEAEPSEEWLLANEMATLRGLLLQPALSAYGHLRWGLDAAVSEPFARLRPELSRPEATALERLLALSQANLPPREALAAVADLYPTYHAILERLLMAARGAIARPGS